MRIDPISVTGELGSPVVSNRYAMRIGNLTLTTSAVDDRLRLEAPWPYSGFLDAWEGDGDIHMEVSYGEVPSVTLAPVVFDSGQSLRMHALPNDRLAIALSSPEYGANPFRVAVFDRSLRRGHLYVRELERWGRLDRDHRTPLVFPWLLIDEALVSHSLLLANSLQVHSVGVDADGRGLLFVGHSGAGKSTMARLWTRRGSTILSDERCILSRQGGEWTMHGTPWISDSGAHSASEIPLRAIYFISHGSTNAVRPLLAEQAALQLVPECVSPLYSAEYLNALLESVAELVAAVPTYDLAFVPDESVVDYLLAQGGTNA